MNRFYSPEHFSIINPYRQELPITSLKSSLSLYNSLCLNPYVKDDIKKIGNYKYNTKDIIGQGFSSKVYKAVNIQDKKQYAIKVIELKKTSQSNIQMLENEIQIIKSLSHPNIIKCYDIYKSKYYCYIVTEYCSGGNLMNFICKNKRASESQAIEFITQIIEGVKYLQSKGIIHRDLKPANILRSKKSWKIADFGFAIFSKTEIKTKFNVGTPLYMPIQSLKDNIYSPQSDIFSIGVIFYELLTGITPWQSKNEKQLIKKMSEIPFKTAASKAKLSSEIYSILKKMCQINKNKRMTMAQFSQFTISNFRSVNSSAQNPQKQQSVRQSIIIPKSLKQIDSRRLYHNRSVDHFQLLKCQSNKQHDYQQQSLLNNCTGSLIINKKQQKVPLSLNSQKLIAKNKSLDKQFFERQQKIITTPSSSKQAYPSSKNIYLNYFQSNSYNMKKNNQINRSKNPLKLIRTISKPNKLQLLRKPQQVYQNEKSQKNISTDDNKSSQKIEIQSLLQIFTLNTHIVINQIHFCRFLFYFYMNLSSVLLSKKTKEKLIILIFKKILSIMEHLSKLQEKNELNLINWKQYIQSQKFKAVKGTIKEYSLKYEKQYLLVCDILDIKKIRQKLLKEEKKYSQQLQVDTGSSSQIKFNKFLLNQLKQFLKECNHNLTITVDSLASTDHSPPQESNKPNKFILSNIQGLKNLYQFYQLTNLSIKCDKDYSLFERKSNIKVNIDYRKNITIKIQDYQSLKEIINKL